MDLKIAPHMNTFTKLDLSVNFRLSKNRERKCADTIGTVLIPWAGHFQCQKYKYIFLIKCTEAILSQTALENCYGLKLANADGSFKNKFIASFFNLASI